MFYEFKLPRKMQSLQLTFPSHSATWFLTFLRMEALFLTELCRYFICLWSSATGERVRRDLLLNYAMTDDIDGPLNWRGGETRQEKNWSEISLKYCTWVAHVELACRLSTVILILLQRVPSKLKPLSCLSLLTFQFLIGVDSCRDSIRNGAGKAEFYIRLKLTRVALLLHYAFGQAVRGNRIIARCMEFWVFHQNVLKSAVGDPLQRSAFAFHILYWIYLLSLKH